jgi:hypothetical protein
MHSYGSSDRTSKNASHQERAAVVASTTALRSEWCAEGVGFEPTETRASTVFKTVPFVRSGIPPSGKP